MRNGTHYSRCSADYAPRLCDCNHLECGPPPDFRSFLFRRDPHFSFPLSPLFLLYDISPMQHNLSPRIRYPNLRPIIHLDAPRCHADQTVFALGQPPLEMPAYVAYWPARVIFHFSIGTRFARRGLKRIRPGTHFPSQFASLLSRPSRRIPLNTHPSFGPPA